MIPENEKTALFLQLIVQHQQLAFMGLGLMENPMTSKKEEHLDYAKTAIETIEVLKEKTKGNLSPYEEEFISTILTQLQLKYVEKSNSVH
jgi:hypothetical protein